ncbi:MAG: 16S rRNA (cytosine(967)-C(5))-methyltransferase [Xenococcaceae cyanobacterium MO_234.B1]|nr:16S rRNA (cytosine(967)-C(5))-methyltransferase [Xenococcaceae cyanobacterium MO_234.B1]
MENRFTNARQCAFLALKSIYCQKAYTDIAIDRILRSHKLNALDRSLVCQIVYGVVRQKRSLDALISLLGKKKASQQPLNLRIILYIGLYQLRYLTQIPNSAAVNTSVELAKKNGLAKLAGVVNGILRNYIRQAKTTDPLLAQNYSSPIEKLGVIHSFPDWIVETWLQQLPISETSELLTWFNQPAKIDLRVNILKTSVEKVANIFQDRGISVSPLPHLPQALRINDSMGDITLLPGYQEGWWIVQDSSAQLVTHLLDPQPGETIIDACAAPGGKTTHIAELMGDRGIIYACDRDPKRLKKVQNNATRLGIKSIQTLVGDSRNLVSFPDKNHPLCDRVPAPLCGLRKQGHSDHAVPAFADRALLDVPCSGLGTLHKRPDIRWRQTPAQIRELFQLQQELLQQVAQWIRHKGILVYATCTLNPLENEKVIQSFLQFHEAWSIKPPSEESPISTFKTPEGWIKVYPHRHNMDGFFMARLQKN